jgi:hypothetical protein
LWRIYLVPILFSSPPLSTGTTHYKWLLKCLTLRNSPVFTFNPIKKMNCSGKKKKNESCSLCWELISYFSFTFSLSGSWRYEGTGRSLSLKLIKQLKEQGSTGLGGRTFREVTLTEPIRYSAGIMLSHPSLHIHIHIHIHIYFTFSVSSFVILPKKK